MTISRHDRIVILIALGAGLAAWGLQHTAYRETVNVVGTVLLVANAARMIYRNVTRGEYRLPNQH